MTTTSSAKRAHGAGVGLRLAAASLAVGLATVGAAILPAQTAFAATDTVTNCSSSVAVPESLPYEVANATSGDTIDFALSPSCSLSPDEHHLDLGQSHHQRSGGERPGGERQQRRDGLLCRLSRDRGHHLRAHHRGRQRRQRWRHRQQRHPDSYQQLRSNNNVQPQ